MASSFHSLLICSLLICSFFTSSCMAKISKPKIKTLVIPVTKDASTLQYVTQIQQRTPLVPVKLTVDLGGMFLWVDCERDYISSTYNPVPCNSAECTSLAMSKACITECYSAPKPGCNNNTCSRDPTNTITNWGGPGEVGQDSISIQTTNGFSLGQFVSMPNIAFVCGPNSLLDGLASGVKGMAGFGRFKFGLPHQFAASFSFGRKFAMCLSSSTSSPGVIFFGDGPYGLIPGIDVSLTLAYTPLLLNPVSTAGTYFEGEASSEYFIGVNGIKINNKAVSLNTSLLSIDKKTGNGGTKISTVNRYTVMETSIYKAVVSAFVKELFGIPRVKAVAPFGACFSSKGITNTPAGPGVPEIDLVLHKEDVFWRIFGANSMIQVNKEVLCLGFVDGGENPRTSIVIGGHQLEEILLQFDLANKRLGISSTILFKHTSCSNFNFTTTAQENKAMFS